MSKDQPTTTDTAAARLRHRIEARTDRSAGPGECHWMTAAERRRWLALDRLPAEERHKAQDNLERQILEKRSHG